ncbi:MAG: hypothetical protein GY798_21825 [Hyphomicrobiales bacterium]|nr:hypothetical protein [Hyphomicrobiales bacterium]
MAKHLGKAITGAAAVGLVVASAAMALASIERNAIDNSPAIDITPQFSEALLPSPTAGEALFVDVSGGSFTGCLTDGDVVRRLNQEQQKVGGETVTLIDGLDQAFADEWRREAAMETVTVSAVFAHVIGNGSDAIVDVVELDETGCAMSRTLLSGDDWDYLLSRAAGREA